MADASLPGAVYNQSQTPTMLPLEAQPVDTWAGISAQFMGAYRSSLPVSLGVQGIGKAAGGGMVPYDEVVAKFKEQKLDPSVFAKGQPISAGEAQTVFNQQLAIQADRDAAARAGTDRGATGFAAGLLGGTTPYAGTGLIAGPLLGAARAGLGALGVATAPAVETGAPLAARVLTGVVEGGVGTGAIEKAQQQVGTAQGDRDITTGQIVQDSLWGSAIGGGLHGTFGERPVNVDFQPFKDMIAGAEGSAAYGKAHGIPADQVVSNKGAVGIYQITPDTAKSLGYNPDMLKNPAYAEQVADANFKKLYQKFGNDPEAIAVAWNGGPGLADRFIKAGRDRAMLPKETQDYLARIDKANGVGELAGSNAVALPIKDLPEGAVQVRGYHGTKADFDDYSETAQGTSSNATDAKAGATFFTSDPDVAAGYANFAATQYPEGSENLKGFHAVQNANAAEGIPKGEERAGQNIRPVNLTLHNPEVVDWKGEMYSQTGFKNAIMAAKAAGKDGVIFKNVNDDVSGKKKLSDVYASFNPNEATQPAFGPRGVPDETDVAVAKTAIAQAEAGSEINVEPVIKAMKDEADGKKADPADLAKAVPVRDSEVTAPVKDILTAMDQKIKNATLERPLPTTGREPNPAVAEIQRLAKEATEEATNLHAGLTGEAAGAEGNKFETYMKSAEKEFDESEAGLETKPDFQTALEAAVQCGIKNGVA